MAGQVSIIRGNTLDLPLDDSSDTDAVELLRPLEARFEPLSDVAAPRGRVASRGPRLDVGLRHKHAPSLPQRRDIAEVCGLVGHVRRTSGPARRLQQRQERLVGVDGGQVPSATVCTSVELATLNGIECLPALDPQVRQQRLTGSERVGRVDLPGVERPTLRRARLPRSEVATEHAVQHLDGLRLDLLNHDAGRIDRLSCIAVALRVVAALDADVAIRVDDASRVGQRLGTHPHATFPVSQWHQPLLIGVFSIISSQCLHHAICLMVPGSGLAFVVIPLMISTQTTDTQEVAA